MADFELLPSQAEVRCDETALIILSVIARRPSGRRGNLLFLHFSREIFDKQIHVY